MKLNILFACAVIAALLFTGCPTDTDSPETKKPDPISGSPTGEATRSADGFARSTEYLQEGHSDYGRQVTLTVKVTAGYITGVVFAEHDETPGIGSTLIEEAPAKIIAKNSFDAISGASAAFTRDAIISAGKAAIEAIKNGAP